MRRAKRVRYPPDLTSLFDVLFIVVFASLIRAAAVQNAAAHPEPPPPKPVPPAPPPDVAALHQKALAELQADLAGRAPLVIRVAETHGPASWSIEALEVDGKRLALDAPLLEHSLDPDIAVAYLGDRSADLQICKIAALHLGLTELSQYLVIITPSAALVDLPHALFDGLHRDVDRCLTEQRGIATLLDPTAM